MEKLDLRQVLKETSDSMNNGHTIEKLEEWRILLKELDTREDRKSLKQAINILESVIRLKKIKNKSKKQIFKQSFLFIMFLFLLIGIQASINYNIGGSNKLTVAQNISTFDGDVLIADGLEVQGTANFTGNVSSGVDFCIVGGLCLTGGVRSPWGNNTNQIFVLEEFPTFINVSDVLFVNRTLGFVGIGTSTPQNTLNVIGDMNITQQLFVGSNATLNGFLTVGINTTLQGFLTLNSIIDISPSESTLLRRDDITGLVGGVGGSLIITNLLNEPTPTSGVNYVWNLGSDNNVTVDLHSSLDPDDPLMKVSHYFNDVKGHIWRLNPNTNNSLFQWESGINNSLFSINGSGLINLNDSIILSSNGSITFPELTECDTIDSDINGLLFCGTDETGGGNASIFGSEFQVFQSLSESTTDDVLINKLVATTLIKPAGTYRIGFFADATNSDGTDLTDIQFLVDGSPVSQHTSGKDLYTMVPHKNNDWLSFSAVQYKILSNSSAINVAIKFGTNDNTAKISNAIIEIWRVAVILALI